MNVSRISAAGIVPGIMELVAGILLLLNPAKFTSTVLIGLGGVLIVLGLVDVVKYFRTDAKTASLGQLLTKGLVSLLAGAFFVIQWEWFLTAFPVLTMVYGIIILLTGISKIQFTIDMLRLKHRRWGWAALNAALTLTCAIVILSSPFATTEVLWCFTGAALVVVGIFDLAVPILCSQEKGASTP